MERGRIPYLAMGGVASTTVGRPRWTHDLDFFVKPEDARDALNALANAGFRTQETDPSWLYKALKDGVLVDVIFESTGDVFVDDEMLSRAERIEFKGVPLQVIPPEDLLVIKALAHDEKSPRHWFDALGILSHADLDWEYLLRRARVAQRRVLSLLVYGQSMDLGVPDGPVLSLVEAVYDARR